jgi:hypothetical protein
MLRRIAACAVAPALAPGIGSALADNPSPTLAPGGVRVISALSSVELWLAIAIILFGLIVLAMQFVLLRRAAAATEDVLRLFTVTMIIIGTMALIAVGYSSQQIAPALGLFGTILGYLLGKTDERMRNRGGAGSDTAGGAAHGPPPAKP